LTPNKKEERSFNNISVFLEKSEFWKGQGMINQKCQSWIDEFKFCDSEKVIQQLQYAEFLYREKIIHTSPAGYIYNSLPNGGISRPSGFEFPEERAVRLQKEAMETRQKAMKDLEKLREQEKALADGELHRTSG